MLTDSTTACPHCRGKGGHSERTQRETYIFETCVWCLGSGRKTVNVDPDDGAGNCRHLPVGPPPRCAPPPAQAGAFWDDRVWDLRERERASQ